MSLVFVFAGMMEVSHFLCGTMFIRNDGMKRRKEKKKSNGCQRKRMIDIQADTDA